MESALETENPHTKIVGEIRDDIGYMRILTEHPMETIVIAFVVIFLKIVVSIAEVFTLYIPKLVSTVKTKLVSACGRSGIEKI